MRGKVKGCSLIITPFFDFKEFYFVYNDSITKIYFCNRWFQIFVTDGLVYFRNRWSSIMFLWVRILSLTYAFTCYMYKYHIFLAIWILMSLNNETYWINFTFHIYLILSPFKIKYNILISLMVLFLIMLFCRFRNCTKIYINTKNIFSLFFYQCVLPCREHTLGISHISTPTVWSLVHEKLLW